MDSAALTANLKAEARRLGFDACGACPAVTPTGAHRLGEWLSQGYAGEMHYIGQRQAAYEHPRHVLEGAQSLLILTLNYRTAEPRPVAPGYGRVSRYAWGDDYHDLIHERLEALARYARELAPGAAVRGVVDTAPLLEREFAQLAGLGWIGKNTLLLNREAGSWFFLAALLLDVELAYDEPHATDHCGTCTACLDACPTGAFVAPYVLDSRRCISYLTIELRGAIPPGLRGGMGEWVYGCDVCQDVCPWNRRAPASRCAELQPSEGTNPLDLASLFAMTDADFRARFRHTPLWRAKRRGLLRNAAVVLGNQRAAAALLALVRGLNDEEPLVRGACAFALGQLGSAPARDALTARLACEADVEVQRELAMALEASEHPRAAGDQAASTHSVAAASATSTADGG